MLNSVTRVSNGPPRVILAIGNGAEISFRNPDAVVVDHGSHAIWCFERRVDFSGAVGRDQLFRFCAALCCVRNGVLFRQEVVDLLWGDDPDGGPLQTSQVISHLLRKARPFMALIGLEAMTMKAPGRILLAYGARASVPRGALYIGHHGARPAEVRA